MARWPERRAGISRPQSRSLGLSRPGSPPSDGTHRAALTAPSAGAGAFCAGYSPAVRPGSSSTDRARGGEQRRADRAARRAAARCARFVDRAAGAASSIPVRQDGPASFGEVRRCSGLRPRAVMSLLPIIVPGGRLPRDSATEVGSHGLWGRVWFHRYILIPLWHATVVTGPHDACALVSIHHALRSPAGVTRVR